MTATVEHLATGVQSRAGTSYSIIVTIGSTTLALLLGTPAAYALSRFKFKLRETIMFWFLSTRVAPPILVALSFFLISRELGLYDTLTLLIIVNVLTNIAWVVFMMRFFFDDIPIDIDESALIDGASWFGAFWRVVVPLVMTGLWVIFMTWQIRQQRAACTSDLT